jgi:hypothetical protein
MINAVVQTSAVRLIKVLVEKHMDYNLTFYSQEQLNWCFLSVVLVSRVPADSDTTRP